MPSDIYPWIFNKPFQLNVDRLNSWVLISHLLSPRVLLLCNHTSIQPTGPPRTWDSPWSSAFPHSLLVLPLKSIISNYLLLSTPALEFQSLLFPCHKRFAYCHPSLGFTGCFEVSPPERSLPWAPTWSIPHTYLSYFLTWVYVDRFNSTYYNLQFICLSMYYLLFFVYMAVPPLEWKPTPGTVLATQWVFNKLLKEGKALQGITLCVWVSHTCSQGCLMYWPHVLSHWGLFLFLYLFLTVLGLCCCAWAFSSWGEQGLLSSCGVWAYWGGFSCCKAWAVGQGCSVVVAHGLSCPTARRVFPEQGWDPCLFHWQVDS